MEWKKAKTILIWLFVIVDMFLLTYGLFVNFGNNKVDFEGLKSVLEGNNIVFSENIKISNRNSIFVHEYKRPVISEKLKEELMGNYDETGDGRYSSKDKKSIMKTDGSEFFYENKSPDFKGFEKLDKKNSDKILEKYLKLFGIEKYADISDISEKDGQYFVSCVFKTEGLEIFSSSLTFVISKKGIHKIYGTLSIADTQNGYKFELSNIETILLNFSRNTGGEKNKKIQIEEIKLGCYLSDYENAVTSQALPVYMIRTNENIYIYDAREGVDSSNRELAIK